jgi:hypothetical protein
MLVRFLKSLLTERASSCRKCRGLAARGKAAFDAMEFQSAADLFGRAHAHCGLDAEGLYMLGAALIHDGRLDEGEPPLQAAIEAQPDNLDAKKMLAMRHLFAGDWTRGFRLYESMRHAAMRSSPLSKPDLNRDWLRIIDHVLGGIPPWRGESLAGKRIIVWSEHGRGDAIMTLRLVSELLIRHGASEVAGLSDMAEKCLFEAAGVSRFFELRTDWKPAAAEFDYHCSIFSLLQLLGVTVDGIPGRVPYLRVPPEKIADWRERVAEIPGPKVGIVWGGNPAVPFDRIRSVSLATLAPLFSVPDVSFISLQKDGPARAELQSTDFPLVDVMDGCADFMDTAALIENLDLVISVDSAVAHLAGAIGKPVWLLNRYESEWRWLRGRDDSVWYPSMRIFNQTEPRNWVAVIARMANELPAAMRNSVA